MLLLGGMMNGPWSPGERVNLLPSLEGSINSLLSTDGNVIGKLHVVLSSAKGRMNAMSSPGTCMNAISSSMPCLHVVEWWHTFQYCGKGKYTFLSWGKYQCPVLCWWKNNHFKCPAKLCTPVLIQWVNSVSSLERRANTILLPHRSMIAPSSLMEVWTPCLLLTGELLSSNHLTEGDMPSTHLT